MDKKGKGKLIQSVQRALDIINCFSEHDVELSLHEISERLELNKSTVHGLLNTLYINRFIQQNDNGNYMLGQALFNKSIYAIRATKIKLRSISNGYMAGLSNKYKCSSHIFTVESNKLHFLDMTTPANSYYIISTVLNDLMHLYCTASGKILLSHMNDAARNDYFDNTEFARFTENTMTSKKEILENLNHVIQNGYAIENEEIEEGCIAIAVPIYTKHSDLFGTISATGSKVKIAGHEDDIVTDLKGISEKITNELF